MGGEESYGYLVGDFVRDKDAVSACCLIAEMAAYHLTTGAQNHKLLAQVLEDIYKKHGYYKEDLLSLTKTGKAGVEEIQQMMANYRNNPPKELGGIPVVMMKDYAVSKSYDFVNKTNTIIDLPTSNVLQFFTLRATGLGSCREGQGSASREEGSAGSQQGWRGHQQQGGGGYPLMAAQAAV